MKICPNCKQENPSSAKHCMVCGTQLVEEELPSEVSFLMKELAEVKEAIMQLKKALAEPKESLENTKDQVPA